MNPMRYRRALSPTLLPHHRHPYSHRNRTTDRRAALASAYRESSTTVIRGDFLSSEALQHPSGDVRSSQKKFDGIVAVAEPNKRGARRHRSARGFQFEWPN